jgi:hypothetical protein
MERRKKEKKDIVLKNIHIQYRDGAFGNTETLLVDVPSEKKEYNDLKTVLLLKRNHGSNLKAQETYYPD